MTNSIRAFLFDLGNVLVRFDHRTAARKIADGTGASPEELFRLFFESPLVVEHDEGRIETREFYEGVKKLTGAGVSYERFLEVWNDIFTEDRQMTGLVAGLLEKNPCYLISNTNRPHFEYLESRVPVLKKLHGRILSYEVGHLKPHPAIYQRVLELARLRSEEVFYVDDREDLVETGRALGFQTHRFTGYEALLKELPRSHPQTVYTELTQLFYHGLQLPGKGMETWPGEK